MPGLGLSLESLEDLRDGGNDPTAGRGRPQTPDGTLGAAMEKAPTLGYVWSSQSFGDADTLRESRCSQSDGSEHVILVVDRLDAQGVTRGRAGLAPQRMMWQHPTLRFSVIELRLKLARYDAEKARSHPETRPRLTARAR